MNHYLLAGILISCTLLLTSPLSAQDPSAIADFESTEQGILIPRMSAAQKQNILNPAEGLMVYQNDGQKGFYYYDGNSWIMLGDMPDADADPNNEIQTLNDVLNQSNSAGNMRISNLQDPVSPQDAATKAYVDANSGGGGGGSGGTEQGNGSNTYAIEASNEGAMAGDPRGEYSVDLQTSRFATTQVAAGDASIILGGEFNTSSANYSIVVGGFYNEASGLYASIGGGDNNVASGTSATIGGGTVNIASGSQSSITGGDNNIAAGDRSNIPGGKSLRADSYGETVVGLYNIASGGNPTIFQTNDPLFVIGNGTGEGNRSNAFLVRKNGNAELNGSLAIMDGTQGLNKVFTSDANGVGSWQTLNVNDADADATNEFNTSALLNGTSLEITDNGGTLTVDLSSLGGGGGGTDDQTLTEVLTEGNSAGNMKITNLSEPTLSQDAATKNYVDTNDDVDDADADATNEIQFLSLSNDSLILSGDTSFVNLSGYLDNTDDQNLTDVLNQGTDAGNNKITNLSDPTAAQDAATKNYVDTNDDVDDADADATNEIQYLSLSNDSLMLSGDTSFVNLSGYLDNTDNQTLSEVLGQGNNAGNSRITNLAEPVNNQDAATKNYVDLLTSGTQQGTGVNTFNIRARNEGLPAGNARGENSVDLQTGRTNVTEISSGNYAVITGGQSNAAAGYASFIGGGLYNSAGGGSSVVAGGESNSAIESGTTIVGGYQNSAAGEFATIGGGDSNSANGEFSIIPGGLSNFADSFGETVVGFYNARSNGDPGLIVNTEPVFVVGNGSSGTNRSNAMVVRKSGDTEIHGDIYLPDSTYGVIFTSPNGSCWKMTVDDTGTQVIASVTCP